jgi:hypothetical protein
VVIHPIQNFEIIRLRCYTRDILCIVRHFIMDFINFDLDEEDRPTAAGLTAFQSLEVILLL